ncbi:Glycosyltransferase involved in cell wall bisynthesis [Rhodospirillales bacterium URHD0017]|nr:Glycosyltransferase involved in cell wall bisynthesis [Rhodospirillales bacterium URHD0017]
MIAQTRTVDEIVVVDDGSQDDPGAVVARYPEVRLIRQENAGLSAARNRGLAAINTDYITFLDADDILAPAAIADNVALLFQHPEAGFVYGAYDRIDTARRRFSGPHFRPVPSEAANAMLVGNPVAMHATVLYDVARLRDVGGFDSTLSSCEDYDVYIRLAQRYPVFCHPRLVASYRIHGSNMSADPVKMLHWALHVLKRYRPLPADRDGSRAWAEAERFWKRVYCEEAVRSAGRREGTGRFMPMLGTFRVAPATTIWQFLRVLKRGVRRIGAHSYRRARPIRAIDMGQLASLDPVSRSFGYDRGTPIDRYYIENFLERHRGDIRGRALEIGDASYCRRFDSGITQQDVLHVSPDAPEATITGDLVQVGVLPEGTFDCMVITQTLHLTIDVREAIARMYAALKPGGVLLLTVPGISPIDRDDWKSTWYWSMTGQSVTRLFGEIFGAQAIEVTVHGNVYVATCFLQGMALEDVRRDWLDRNDSCYPVIIAVRARRMGRSG